MVPEFHTKKNQDKTKMVLRLLVLLYLLYLTKKIIEAEVKGNSSLPLWVTVLVSIVFVVASAAFGIYIWREYKHSSSKVIQKDKESVSDKPEDTQEH
jgi:protein-S-isoprenylcysteine O-methyltransferase Ste14